MRTSNAHSLMLIAVAAGTIPAMGCTTLGPMPGMTMADPVAESRSGAEVSGAVVPGWYLSDTTQQDPDRDKVAQLSGFFDPGDLWPLQGLSIGGRWVTGGDETGFFEPMVRYRRYLGSDDVMSLSIVGYGTHVGRSASGASYTVTRGGAELSTDIRVTPRSRWAELHLLGGASLTGIGGDGTYCMNGDTGYGVDCEEGVVGDADVELLGAYPAAFVGLAVDLGEHLDAAFHGVRLGGYMAGGTMPRVRFAEQEDSPESWFTWGANLSVGFGAAE